MGSQLSEVLIDDFVDAFVLLTPRVVVGRVLLSAVCCCRPCVVVLKREGHAAFVVGR